VASSVAVHFPADGGPDVAHDSLIAAHIATGAWKASYGPHDARQRAAIATVP
jgi:hypothetical protein